MRRVRWMVLAALPVLLGACVAHGSPGYGYHGRPHVYAAPPVYRSPPPPPRHYRAPPPRYHSARPPVYAAPRAYRPPSRHDQPRPRHSVGRWQR